MDMDMDGCANKTDDKEYGNSNKLLPHPLLTQDVQYWKQSCHDANFVITGGTRGSLMTTSGASSDDKVGIMITLISVQALWCHKTMMSSRCFKKGKKTANRCIFYSIYLFFSNESVVILQ